MPGVVVVGLQWGDEGKGKVVDFYAQEADLVVRFNGGNNAGHTVIVKGEVHKLHLLPSGVIAGKESLIGAGLVVDPKVLLSEIEMLQSRGITPKLSISKKAHIILPFHIFQDGEQETFKGKYKAGTTKRGIGPCYSDKAARFGIRIEDLMDPKVFREKFDFMCDLKTRVFRDVYGKEFDYSGIYEEYVGYGKRIKQYVQPVSRLVNTALDHNKKVLFEGAQGTMLDLDHGYYPYGTSSNCIAGAACTGVGVGPTKISRVVGVLKAYTSRVGEGIFPTELTDETCRKLQQLGGEVGTTTGRTRRVGWFDAVTAKYSCMVNSVTDLAITKIDILGGFETVKMATKYQLPSGEIITHMDAPAEALQSKPIYEEVDGWEHLAPEQWREIALKGYKEIPANAQKYMEKISKLCHAPVTMVSVGPGREDTIIRKNIWKD
ncbi:Adenylosuccinate synthetase [Candidatus Gugararchaeum adminiculabundum]|nr:Adenylosuccinate synthetase [Candidatus Gugararchaeum adminiculabundum]